MIRLLTRTTQTAIDLAVLSLAFWLAFLLRFEFDLPTAQFKRAMILWPYVVGMKYAVLIAFGVQRFSWRYIGLREVNRILFALAVGSAVLLGARLSASALMELAHWLRHLAIPIGVVLIDFTFAFLGIAGVRVTRRLVGERAVSGARRRASAAAGDRRVGEPVPTLLIGAGEAGVMVAKEIASWPELGIRPVGFLDDDPLKAGTEIHGIRVLGGTADLAAVAARTDARQALITIANASGRDIRRINDACREAGLTSKIIPGVYEIVGGQVNLERIRPVAIEDLLGREPVQLEEEVIGAAVRGRTVLVTGAGGSIGSELCRQILRFDPALLVLAERSENGLFEIHRELTGADPDQPVVPCVADVTDEARMRWIFDTHAPDVVLHAAAHKHVPMMEWNPGEAVKNNVFGTKVVADLADASGTARFVLVSTDKAVNPTSVMGATKRVAEMYVQALAQKSRTKFVAVRFGNVLGSAGSVVPIFREQIARGGPVTVTHPEMQRYFMTIPESCQLVLQAGAMGEGGEVFILDMGEPVKIADLARDMIRLSGLEPDEDVAIEFTGVRPGEKLFEELSVAEEAADRTRHAKVFVARVRASAADGDAVAGLPGDLRGWTDAQVVAWLSARVPEYEAPAESADSAEAVVGEASLPRAANE